MLYYLCFNKINPKNHFKLKEFRKFVTELRKFAKTQILTRMNEIKTDEKVVRNDILSFILKTPGILHC